MDAPPKYLLRDRDKIYGEAFRKRVKGLGLEEVLIAPRSPWQNPYVERLIGSIRRELLDRVIILNDRHLKRTISSYLRYYHRWRVHQDLEMDAPKSRPVLQSEEGRTVGISQVGGLHHHYRVSPPEAPIPCYAATPIHRISIPTPS